MQGAGNLAQFSPREIVWCLEAIIHQLSGHVDVLAQASNIRGSLDAVNADQNFERVLLGQFCSWHFILPFITAALCLYLQTFEFQNLNYLLSASQ